MAKGQSRAKRWQAAIDKARGALTEIETHMSTVTDALTELQELKGEYEEWQGNLPENLASSPLGEKLQVIVDLDLEPEEGNITAITEAIDEAEQAELPLGFGRD